MLVNAIQEWGVSRKSTIIKVIRAGPTTSQITSEQISKANHVTYIKHL